MINTGFLKRLIGYVLIALMLVGCGGAAVEPTVTPTIPPSPTPLSAEEILKFAIAEMEELDTYHFTMVLHMTTVSGGTSTETPLIFTGDFKAPDRFQGEMKLELGELSIETEIIMIGESVYIKDSVSGEWQMSTEPATPFTPEDFVGLEASEITNMVGLNLIRETVLDGVPVYHLVGRLPPGLLEAVLGEAGGKAKVAYWIGVEDGWMRKMNIDMEFSIEGDETIKMRVNAIVNFSEFNKQVIIEAP